MSIQFACKCGQLLAAREEHAGMQVRCSACGAVATVPAVAKPPRPAPATAETIRFECDCGQVLQARPEHAGKQTRCPGCGKTLSIPTPRAQPTHDLPQSFNTSTYRATTAPYDIPPPAV